MNYEDDAVGFFPQSILRVDDGVKLGAAGRGWRFGGPLPLLSPHVFLQKAIAVRLLGCD